ncbi:Histone deacetylase hda1 [Spiromyces aspiralis]|uniref:Histone deacetylase hda1 n=1 Tax=Spiromyces aspiralis TaxID=68401 RepID=A0ACC1HJD2_9FUNG|nr:Histone deacetylase hda1 [Spiromyces aspiralis]
MLAVLAGNGIQEIFREDPDVLYISIHRWEDGKFYPELSQGEIEYVGEGRGVGRNINIAWPCAGMGDGDYLYAFKNVVMPVAREFDPDFVIVACGFDAAVGDPLGQCLVTPECYAHMTRGLKTLAGGKLVLSLEGGYNLDAIANSALGCVKALLPMDWNEGIVPRRGDCTDYALVPEYVMLGDDYRPEPVPIDPISKLPEVANATPSEVCLETVDKVRKVHSQYWACFKTTTTA